MRRHTLLASACCTYLKACFSGNDSSDQQERVFTRVRQHHLAGAPAALCLALLMGAPLARAEGWSSPQGFPFGKKGPSASRQHSAKKPSLLKQLDNGTKKFFAGARNALKFENPFASKKPAARPLPWQQPARRKKPKSTPGSLLGSWFQPKEPKAPESLDEFMRLKRLDP